MNKSIQKLINLLTNMYDSVTKEIKKDISAMLFDEGTKTMSTALAAGQLGLWLSLTDEETQNHKVIFDNFPLLSRFLEAKEFNDRDVFTIINYVISKNISQSILNDLVEIKLAEVSLTEFNDNLFNMDNIREYGKDNTYFESYIRMQKQRMSCETAEPNTKEGLFDRELSNYEELKKEHNRINESYFKKAETYTELDLVPVCAALLQLGFSPEIAKKYCNYMKILLEKRLEKEAELARKSKTTEPKEVQPKIEPKPINQRLIKKTFKELEIYFDFFNMEPIRPLSYDEMILCLAKIKQTDCTIGLMNEFITKQDRFNLQNDPILNAENILKRLKAYQESFEEQNSDYVDVTTTIESLEEYLKEIKLTETEEDKQVWMEFINEELPYALSLLPKHTI